MSGLKTVAAALALLALLPARAAAFEWFCDPAENDCRAPLLQLIETEPTAIDVGFWFMEDAEYSAALSRAAARGVKVRVVWDSDSLDPNNSAYETRVFIIDQLRAARIPMIEKTNSGIAHWKMMLFVGHNTVQFSGANYTAEAFVYQAKYSDYVDEVIFYTDKENLVRSFKRAFDDVWTNTADFSDYANVTTRVRSYPLYEIDPQLQFYRGFREWSVAHYNAETHSIDAIIYRITDRAHTDALIEAVKRGVKIRLITEPHQYSDRSRLWHRWNVDRLYVAGQQHKINGEPGVQIRHRKHLGLLHEKLTLLHGQRVTVIGSSNWTSPSTDSQLEHNLFSTDLNFYAWSVAHFERKWNNTAPNGAQETEVFVPLGPDTPQLNWPQNGATGVPTSLDLHWDGGDWSHRYDVFLGTNPSSLTKILDDVELGPWTRSLPVSALSAGTTYYWRVVGRTMAGLSATSSTWSFTTAGTPSGNAPPLVALTSPASGSSFTAPAVIPLAADAQDPDGTIAAVEFYAGSTLIASDTAAPFGVSWSNVPAGTYSLTARAIDNVGAATTSAAVSITVSSGTVTPLPAPWAQQDVGPVGVAGSGAISGGTWTVSGSGSDIWGSADEFHYVYQPLTGNGSIVARVTSIQHVDDWTKAGVMIRETLAPSSPHAFMIVTPGGAKGLAFQRRTSAGGGSTHTGGGPGVPPKWVRLTRSGSTISAFWSDNGVTWNAVGSDTIAMASTVYFGLAVTSHANNASAAATFDNVEVVADSGTPPPNTAPLVTLTSPTNGSTFTEPASITLTAAASDNDGTVATVEFLSGSTVVGSRSSAPYTLTLSNVTAGTYSFSARATDDDGASATSNVATVTVGASPPPASIPAPWDSRDIGAVGVPGDAGVSGGTWTVRGSGADVWGSADQFRFVYQPMTGNGRVVARVASVQHADDWTKAGVMIRSAMTPESAHAFMIVTPGNVKGLAFQRRQAAGSGSVHTAGGPGTAPAWVSLVRSGSTITAYRSSDGATWTMVGSDSIAMGETVYVGLAVSSHNNGVLAAATFDSVSVTPESPQPPPNAPPTVTLTSPANGATFAAPATLTLAASATDSDGSVAQVEFFAGSTSLGIDTTSPYSITWSGVPAGTYTLTARATDNVGTESVSPAVTVQVTGPPPGGLPAGWSSTDIGSVAAAGSSSSAGAVITVTGSGADIWDSSDEFQFAYTTMTGDGTITARVDSVDWIHQWTKAGVMIRAALTPGSRHAMMVVSAGKGLAFQRRVNDGGASTHTGGSMGVAPTWVRLQRSGSTITAYESADGVTWTLVGSETMNLPSTVFVGLPVTSHTDGVLATARFSGVSVTP